LVAIARFVPTLWSYYKKLIPYILHYPLEFKQCTLIYVINDKTHYNQHYLDDKTHYNQYVINDESQTTYLVCI